MLLSLVALLAIQTTPPPADWVIPAGETVLYDTTHGPVRVHSLVVEEGAMLRLQGPRPFVLVAEQVQVDGLLVASGFHSKPVITLLTPFFPEPGPIGGPGGGGGGIGSPLVGQSSPKGGDGVSVHGPPLALAPGGGGGETAFSAAVDKNLRRGAGGGGGRFAADVPGGGVGLVATAGRSGHPLGAGAISAPAPAQGGRPNPSPFQDGDPANDFFGIKRGAAGGLIVGELLVPRGGAGGGAGGDSIEGGAFPTVPFGPPYVDKKGAAGGSGGGLALVVVRDTLRVGPQGRILADGGNGATGENVLGFDHVGGSSGGGSGGMLILQAGTIDLQAASAGALSAVGGQGGVGMSPTDPIGAGGDGGPGVIQLHVADPGDVLLPPSAMLSEVSVPEAHVLLPLFP